MSRGYFSYEENEANKEGHNDEEREYERKRQEELEYQAYLASQEEPLEEPPQEYFISKSSEEELWNQILIDEREEYENR